MKRKLIGFITAFPEAINVQRLLEGVFSRCAQLDYDVAVISPMSQVCIQQEDYLTGELNIYNLINFELFDGIIIEGGSLVEDGVTDVLEALLKQIREKCNKPVVSLGLEIDGYKSFYTKDSGAFREVTKHVVEDHGCRDIYVLSGTEGHKTSVERLSGILEELKSHGITLENDRIIHGDFWYTSGTSLAERIASGELHKPEAIICASDHMAIGLVNRLVELGIRVPQDIIVTGFDATRESALNDVTITSYIPESAHTAEDAVDYLRSLIEPEAECVPAEACKKQHLRSGMSCGCNHDYSQLLSIFRDSIYNINRDYSRGNQFANMDIGLLMESYMFEYLTATKTPEDSLHEIYLLTYLLQPYKEFWLCIDEKWLEREKQLTEGYPRRMLNAVHATPEPDSGHYKDGQTFDTSLMLPALTEYRDKPSVFYFLPVHFQNRTFGYGVIRCELDQEHRMNAVIRNWLRNINNALEMTRAHNRLISLSTRDGMTGAYNRRGMELLLDEMLIKASATDSVLAFVIDMDRLKYINDTFGHEEGDYGINAVCDAARSITENGEICVRAGGDEFYVLGIGNYSDVEIEGRIERFNAAVKEANSADKPYEISASIGSACVPISSGMQVTGIIRIADAKMYESKVRKKMQRG